MASCCYSTPGTLRRTLHWSVAWSGTCPTCSGACQQGKTFSQSPELQRFPCEANQIETIIPYRFCCHFRTHFHQNHLFAEGTIATFWKRCWLKLFFKLQAARTNARNYEIKSVFSLNVLPLPLFTSSLLILFGGGLNRRVLLAMTSEFEDHRPAFFAISASYFFLFLYYSFFARFSVLIYTGYGLNAREIGTMGLLGI